MMFNLGSGGTRGPAEQISHLHSWRNFDEVERQLHMQRRILDRLNRLAIRNWKFRRLNLNPLSVIPHRVRREEI